MRSFPVGDGGGFSGCVHLLNDDGLSGGLELVQVAVNAHDVDEDPDLAFIGRFVSQAFILKRPVAEVPVVGKARILASEGSGRFHAAALVARDPHDRFAVGFVA